MVYIGLYSCGGELTGLRPWEVFPYMHMHVCMPAHLYSAHTHRLCAFCCLHHSFPTNTATAFWIASPRALCGRFAASFSQISLRGGVKVFAHMSAVCLPLSDAWATIVHLGLAICLIFLPRIVFDLFLERPRFISTCTASGSLTRRAFNSRLTESNSRLRNHPSYSQSAGQPKVPYRPQITQGQHLSRVSPCFPSHFALPPGLIHSCQPCTYLA